MAFHNSVYRNFFSKYATEDSHPTIGDYAAAIRQALKDAGCDPVLANAVADYAKAGRAVFGYKDSDPLPKLPYPNRQK